jgi:hypothetical protein
MLNEVKHPYWIPRYARNDIACHAERSASKVKHPYTGFLAAFGMTSLVMLNEVKHPYTGFLTAFGMTSLVMLNGALAK